MAGKTLHGKFQYALEMVKSLPKPTASDPVQFSNDDKLQMYALFKQADVGPCRTKRPGMFDVVGRYKWDAWNELGDISKEAAMRQYLDTMIGHAKRFPGSDSLQKFLKAIEDPPPPPSPTTAASVDQDFLALEKASEDDVLGYEGPRSSESTRVADAAGPKAVDASPEPNDSYPLSAKVPAVGGQDSIAADSDASLVGVGAAAPMATGQSFITSTPRPRRVLEGAEQPRPRSRALFEEEPGPVPTTVDAIYADDPATAAWLQSIQQDLARTTERVAAVEGELRSKNERSMRRNSTSILRWLRQRNDSSTVLWILWPVLAALLVQRLNAAATARDRRR